MRHVSARIPLSSFTVHHSNSCDSALTLCSHSLSMHYYPAVIHVCLPQINYISEPWLQGYNDLSSWSILFWLYFWVVSWSLPPSRIFSKLLDILLRNPIGASLASPSSLLSTFFKLSAQYLLQYVSPCIIHSFCCLLCTRNTNVTSRSPLIDLSLNELAEQHRSQNRQHIYHAYVSTPDSL